MKKMLLALLVATAAGCTAHGPASGEKWAQLTFGNRIAGARRELGDPDPNTRRWAILRLAHAGDLSATGQITPLLDVGKEPSEIVRATAAVGLRALADKRALPELVAALSDPAPLVRADIVETIGYLGDSAQAPALARVLQTDPDARVRLQAAVSLRRAAGAQAAAPLVLALDDPDESVSFAAHQGLMVITGQSLPPSGARWENWLKSAEALTGK